MEASSRLTLAANGHRGKKGREIVSLAVAKMLATGLNNSHVLLLMAQHEGPTHRCFVSITVEKHDYVASIFYSLVHERHLDTGFQPGFLPM